MFELDHVFVFPRDRCSAERLLIDSGISIGARGVHDGQGTANAVAFFDNAYFELLWSHDEVQLCSDLVRPLCLWERARWFETGAIPFGVSVRPSERRFANLPFETWPYEAAFSPRGASIPIVSPRDNPKEPMVFVSLVSQAPATLPKERCPPLMHRGKRRTLSHVRILQPLEAPVSEGVAMLAKYGLFEISGAPSPCLELTWDEGVAGEVLDLRPNLPVLIRM